MWLGVLDKIVYVAEEGVTYWTALRLEIILWFLLSWLSIVVSRWKPINICFKVSIVILTNHWLLAYLYFILLLFEVVGLEEFGFCDHWVNLLVGGLLREAGVGIGIAVLQADVFFTDRAFVLCNRECLWITLRCTTLTPRHSIFLLNGFALTTVWVGGPGHVWICFCFYFYSGFTYWTYYYVDTFHLSRIRAVMFLPPEVLSAEDKFATIAFEG